MSAAPGEDKFKPRFPGDRATAPVPLEDDSDAAWDEFMRLRSGTGSATEAGELGASGAEPGATPRISVEDTLMLARQNNRACPLPVPWDRLQALLPALPGDVPPKSITKADWQSVSAMDKRLVLRRQIEWAAAHGALGAVHAFLRALPDEAWDYLPR